MDLEAEVNINLIIKGGIADVLSNTYDYTDKNFWSKYFFDLLFFLLINLIVLNLIFGKNNF
jgi:hypothetical protein